MVSKLGIQAFYSSLLATMAFGVIFNVPKKSILSGGIIGMVGWVLYISLINRSSFDMVSATLTSAFVVATLSQFLARYQKMPVTVFSIAGIIPLVPGGLAYDTMRHFVEDDYTTAIKLATETFLLSGAIAFGLVFSGVISQILRRNEHNNDK